jgi:hypothetical protein
MGMPQAQGKLLLSANEQAGIIEVDLNSDEAAGTYQILGWDENGNYGPIGEIQVKPDGTGRTELKLDQKYSAYESVRIVPKSLDGHNIDDGTVLQFVNPDMGSTGTGAATMP